MAAPETGEGANDGLFGFLSRRRFLRATLVTGGAVLGLGGAGLLALRGRAPEVEGLAVLDSHEYKTVQSLIEVMFPRTEAVPVDVASMELGRAFDEFLAGEPAHNVKDLKSALVLIEFGPLAFDARPTTFSRLDPDARLAHWNSWATSDVLLRRQVSIAMRKFFNLVFFDHEAVWPYIGYPGPSMLRSRRVRQ
ncbi:MAG: hypothetical protein WBG86_06990 [Polyangiales bacterium]